MWRNFACLLLFCFLSLLLSQPCNAQVNSSDVRRKLKQFDSIYMENGFTATGTQINPRSFLIPSIPSITNDWKITVKRGVVAIELTARIIDLKYQDSETVRGVTQDNSGNCRFSVPIKQYNYYGTDLGGIFREHSIYRIDRNDKVLNIVKAHDVTVFGASDTEYSRDQKEILWSLGRGYSDYISEVTNVTPLKDDQILVSALGHKSKLYPGRWEMVIDKKAAWMVRQARFYQKKRSKISVF